MSCHQQKIINARRQFYKKQIAEAAGDPWRCWSAIRKVLHVAESKMFQSPEEYQNLADAFSSFFSDKIRTTKELIKARSAAHETEPLQYNRPLYGSAIWRATITCRLHSNFRHQVMCRCIRSSDRLPGETVVQQREVPDAVQDRVHHAAAKEKGDWPWCSKQLSTYFEPAHYIEDVGNLFMSRIRSHVETSTNFNRFQSA